ncbi:16S rRNA (cytosine(967)-C(5))-methyltransferase RsmB [Streptococcus caprae]|uniref:16S rRNA (cytosine(967)-C(5))-methyltransferase n=1 Tax=Streptococcus caprae TaxID=1640501 RepID=A0ABV8CWH2_9STRE
MANKWKTTSRGQALLILEDIFDKGAYSNIALNKALSASQLTSQDKGLVTELVYGTVARKLTLEWYLAHYIEDRDKLETWVYYLLMLSFYQLLYLDKIPDHAVVNAAVDLAKERSRQRGSDKLVNAVLRRFLREERPDIDAIKRVNKRYSIRYSLPVWLVKKLIDQYGEERALAIFDSLLTKNKASIRVVDPKAIQAIAEQTGADRSQLSPVGLTKSSGHFAAMELFQSGQITIQDETSQLVAPTLAIRGDERILDACAAPGGKTVHMASELTTGSVVALDLHPHKLDLIEENAQRLGLTDRIQTVPLDARKVHQHFPADSFDKILVDAPCSGIGLMRRKPDIKYTKDLQDFDSLQAIQLEILASVCQTLRKDGIITYSTCTIVAEENQEVLKKFLETHPNFEQVPLSHSCQDIVQDGCLVITPELFQTDGFFIGQVRRVR